MLQGSVSTRRCSRAPSESNQPIGDMWKSFVCAGTDVADAAGFSSSGGYFLPSSSHCDDGDACHVVTSPGVGGVTSPDVGGVTSPGVGVVTSPGVCVVTSRDVGVVTSPDVGVVTVGVDRTFPSPPSPLLKPATLHCGRIPFSHLSLSSCLLNLCKFMFV